MKFFIVLFIQTMLLMQIVSAQKTSPIPNSNLEQYKFFMKKRNTDNTIGWVCLSVGFGMGIIGVGEAIDYGLLSKSRKGEGLWIAGDVLALASIPFFITAHTNKKKASLALKGENVTLGNRILYKTSYTAMSLTINF
jgi:hypothetical protein